MYNLKKNIDIISLLVQNSQHTAHSTQHTRGLRFSGKLAEQASACGAHSYNPA